MIDPDTERVLGWTGGATLTVYILNMLWRVFGKTRVGDARDRAEIDILNAMREENKLLRERIRLTETERDAARAEANELRQQIVQLKADVATLETRITTLLDRTKLFPGH